jgi:hypothetical protein
MEKKVVVARTDMPTLRICAGYREIYSGPGSPMERLEVTQCSRKSPRFQIHLNLTFEHVSFAQGFGTRLLLPAEQSAFWINDGGISQDPRLRIAFARFVVDFPLSS